MPYLNIYVLYRYNTGITIIARPAASSLYILLQHVGACSCLVALSKHVHKFNNTNISVDSVRGSLNIGLWHSMYSFNYLFKSSSLSCRLRARTEENRSRVRRGQCRENITNDKNWCKQSRQKRLECVCFSSRNKCWPQFSHHNVMSCLELEKENNH